MVINFTPDGGSQFIDYFSNGYAQLDLDPDGMYNIGTTDLQNPGGGGVNGFATDWSNIGTLTIDGTETPTIDGTFDIIGTTGFDINSYVDGDSFSIYSGFGGGSYTTTINNIDPNSEVTFSNGIVTDLQFDADITFAMQGLWPFSGTIQITESSFSIQVDETFIQPPSNTPIRQAWNLFGGSAAVPVPEPSFSALLLSFGAAALLGLYRRRRIS